MDFNQTAPGPVNINGTWWNQGVRMTPEDMQRMGVNSNPAGLAEQEYLRRQQMEQLRQQQRNMLQQQYNQQRDYRREWQNPIRAFGNGLAGALGV